jgi:hypothetical protein
VESPLYQRLDSDDHSPDKVAMFGAVHGVPIQQALGLLGFRSLVVRPATCARNKCRIKRLHGLVQRAMSRRTCVGLAHASLSAVEHHSPRLFVGCLLALISNKQS